MEWETMFHTYEELTSEEVSKWTQWGRWTLDTEGAYYSLDICPYANGGLHGGPYEIRLFEYGCSFPVFTEWLGRWVQHLQCKVWLTPEDLWNFVNAAQELHRWGKK